MTKAVITIECLGPSDWSPEMGFKSKLYELLGMASWELINIDTESVQAFPERGVAQGVMFKTNEMPISSFKKLADKSAEYPGIILTTINITEPIVIHGGARRELKPDMRIGASRVRVSEPPLLTEKELGLSDNQG